MSSNKKTLEDNVNKQKDKGEKMSEEKQYQLARRRAVYKEKSEVCTGKDREKKNVERRELLQQEMPEERESRLAKRRAADKEKREASDEKSRLSRLAKRRAADKDKREANNEESRLSCLAKRRAADKEKREANDEVEESRLSRLAKRRAADKEKREVSDEESRLSRLVKRRAADKEKREANDKESRLSRLAKRRAAYKKKREAEETPEKEESRLAKQRAAYKRRSETCTSEDMEKRREQHMAYIRARRQAELSEKRQQIFEVDDSEPEVSYDCNTIGINEEVVENRTEYLNGISIVDAFEAAFRNAGETSSAYISDVETNEVRVPNNEANEAQDIVTEVQVSEEETVPNQAGDSRNEYLHEGGWQNAENPLHEQDFVRNEMHSFHLDQEHLEHRQCTVCKEAWPTRQNLNSEVYICYRCKRDKKSPKKFSVENDMDPGIVPEQLRGLTQVEEMLVSRVCPIMSVYRKHGGQRGYRGHVLNLPQDVQSFLNRLPCRVNELPVLIVRRHGVDDTHRDFTVRRHRVLEAILWLKTNNPYFKDIEIDRAVIQSLPENGVPEELRYVIDSNEVSVHVENEGPPQDPAVSANNANNDNVEELDVLGSDSTSFIPMRQRQRKEGAAIQDAVNEVDPLDWPSTEGNIVNEFKTDGLASMAFPTLFPYGKGDPTKRARQHSVTLAEAFKHLIKFAEMLANGKFEWRFASHPRFPYWALDMKQRHQLLSQANIYLRQHPADANMTMEELKNMVNSMSANHMVNRLQRYVSKVQGTNQYWYQRCQELLALIEQKGCPTFFFTFSAADMHWPDLQKLLQSDEGATRTERSQAVIDNPHLTDWFFMQKLQEFVRHWLSGVLDAKWFWYRFEYQARGSIHVHGCAKLTNDPELTELRTKAIKGFLVQNHDQTRNDIPPENFESIFQDLVQEGADSERLLVE